MDKLMYLIIVSVLFSCNDISNQPDSTGPVNKPNNGHIGMSKRDFYRIPYEPIEFKETEIIKAGDSIILFGGDEGFLKRNFGTDSCRAIVEKVVFTKMTGELAFIELQNADEIPFYMTISLYYLGSKRGYKESYLSLWNRIPTDEEIDEASKDLGFRADMKLNDTPVDLNLGFTKLN